MPVYTPKFSQTGFVGGKNILASEHLQYVEGGATLSATAFGARYVALGELIARNSTSGKWVPFVAADVANYDDFGIINVDWTCDGTNDGIVGEVIVRGSVYEDKLPTNAGLATFKPKVPMIRFVSHA